MMGVGIGINRELDAPTSIEYLFHESLISLGEPLVMHAVIKIICFLVFSAAISMGDAGVLLVGLLMVVPLYFFNIAEQERVHLGTAVMMLKRLRWLLLSIFIVYVFFTPGVLVWPGVLWSPTEEGVLQGLSRVAVLVLIVAAVNVLLVSTKQADFLAAVHWCLQPLAWFGMPHQRLAVRIALTLESVSAVRKAYQHESRGSPQDAPSDSQSRRLKLSTIANTAQRLFSQTVNNAETAPLREIALPEQSRPPLIQWGIPLLVAATLMMAKTFAVNWV